MIGVAIVNYNNKKNRLGTFPEIKILIVDDREDNLVSLQAALSKDGYTFRTAKSGTEALKILLNEFDFTLILMDVQMPIIDGLETAKMIYEREKLKHIPIIFITAEDYNESLLMKGYETGGVDYINKPINPDLLRAKVSVFVELYRKTHLLMAQEEKLKEVNIELEERVNKRTQELSSTNEELNKAVDDLKRVNSDLDTFVYSASHDLKSPISNIEGLLHTLEGCVPEEVKEDDTVKEILKMIDQSMAKFRSTIKDLTEITKVKKNFSEGIEEVDLAEIVEDVKINLSELIKNSEAKVDADLGECPNVKFSKKNIYSIFQNLISNAIKYRSPDRKPEVQIKATFFEDYVLIKVRDNGLGIKPEDKEKAFSIFKRLHGHVEGSGVGLYIVKKILEDSGGKIELESQPDKGSLFKVFIKK